MSPVTPVAHSETIEALRPASKPSEMLDDARVARWLALHPTFFETHSELLADIRLRHGHRGKALSLIERQVALLREKNQELASRLDELIRFGQENDALNGRLMRLNGELLRTVNPSALPSLLADGLRQLFNVPQVAIRLFGIDPNPSSAIRRLADALTVPYCGPSVHAEVAEWLPGGGKETVSVVLFALRVNGSSNAFGLVAMGSPDANRFQAGLGTAFLEQLAKMASASLSRLKPT